MAAPTNREKADKALTSLCNTIATSAAYDTLKAYLYERVQSSPDEGISPDQRAALQLGAVKAVDALFAVIDQNIITPETNKQNAEEY